jgi:KDO2-lipid IV(A) lauroyltransferase
VNKLTIARFMTPVVGRFPWAFYPVAALAGEIAWFTRPGARRALTRNMLPLCDGDRARARREGRRALRNIARYWVDLASIPYRKMHNFERDHLRVVHPERLKALEEPGPVILVSAHAGSSELALQAIIHRGRSFVALVEDVQPPGFAEFLISLRSAAGGRFYTTGFRGTRACIEALRSGGTVGLLGDRDLQGSGICVTLAGHRVRLPAGPWELAQRTGATVIPAFAERTLRDRYVVIVEEPMRVAMTEPPSCGVEAAVQHWATLLERHLRRVPGQWTVMEDFWKVHRCG